MASEEWRVSRWLLMERLGTGTGGLLLRWVSDWLSLTLEAVRVGCILVM